MDHFLHDDLRAETGVLMSLWKRASMNGTIREKDMPWADGSDENDVDMKDDGD